MEMLMRLLLGSLGIGLVIFTSSGGLRKEFISIIRASGIGSKAA